MAAAKGSGSLSFAGTLVKVESKAARVKDDYQGKRLEGGSIAITIEVERPELPKEPRKPYGLNGRKPAQPGPAPTFEEPARNEDEADKAYKSRVAQARKLFEKNTLPDWERAQKAWDEWAELESEYAEELREHQAKCDALSGNFESYARLAGVGALLQGLSVQGSLRPNPSQMKSFLPGFSPAGLLASPAGGGEEG